MNNYICIIMYIYIYENHDEIWWKFVQNIHQIMKNDENRDELWWKGFFHFFFRMYMYWTKLSHDEIKTRKNKNNMQK